MPSTSTEVARTPQVGMRVVVPATASDDRYPLATYVDIVLPATGTVVPREAHALATTFGLWSRVEGVVFVDLDGQEAYSGDRPVVVLAADLALEA